MSRLVRPKPSKKRLQKEPAPMLPQHQLPEPYARLLTLGIQDAKTVYDATAAQLRAEAPQAGMDRLVEMALDESYYTYENGVQPPDPRIWTRVHALRTLGRFEAEAAFAVEPLLVLLPEEDDWLREEIPFFYAAVGEAALEPLAKLLLDPNADPEARGTAVECIAEIGEQHADLHDRAVALLTSIVNKEREDPTLVAFAIGDLLNLNALESLPLIEQAFQEDRVDLGYIQLPDVQEYFGLPVTAPRIDLWDDFDETEPFEDDEALGDEETFDTEEFDAIPGVTPVEEPQQPYIAPLKVGRNEPCPCGSGKKYKKCCGASAA